ncbi:MAG: DUF4065 domain-containing protein [Christensenellaceae bacterium]|nr:DUF4065 domain-containing protein [Christensenellaceae bacterium]
MTKVDAVANFFIVATKLNEDEDSITNLRLNKLLYFAQAWYVALKDRPLFSEPIEAWTFGPVVRSIYNKYSDLVKSPIANADVDFNLSELSEEELDVLFAVMAEYGQYSTSKLVDMSHEKGGAWEKVYVENMKNVIPIETIQQDFVGKSLRTFEDSTSAASAEDYHNAAGTLVLPADWKDKLDIVYG